MPPVKKLMNKHCTIKQQRERIFLTESGAISETGNLKYLQKKAIGGLFPRSFAMQFHSYISYPFFSPSYTYPVRRKAVTTKQRQIAHS